MDRNDTHVKLTKSTVDSLPTPETGYAIFRDSELPGFGVRVMASGTKVFFLERRVRGERHPKRIKLGRYGDLTVDQARKEAVGKAGEIARGGNPVAKARQIEAESVKLSEALNGYLKDRKLKPLTVKDCERVLKRNLKDWMSRRVVDITPDAVQKRFGKIKERSEAQANLTMRYLRAVLNYAAGRWTAPDGTPLLVHNPVRTLTASKVWCQVERRQTVIKLGDFRAWGAAVTALGNEVASDYFLFTVLTGLRREEGLGLTWARVNLTDEARTIYDGKGNPVDVEKRSLVILDTKAKRPHSLPLSDYLVELLERRKAATVPECPWVFADGLGRRLSNLRYAMEHVTAGSKVGFCVHDLRRTFATVAESVDVPGYALKHLLNHSTKADVTAGYLVVDVERLRRPMQRISDHILRLAGLRSGEVIPFPAQAVEAEG